MSATRPTTPQTVYEKPNDEVDPADPSQESPLPIKLRTDETPKAFANFSPGFEEREPWDR